MRTGPPQIYTHFDRHRSKPHNKQGELEADATTNLEKSDVRSEILPNRLSCSLTSLRLGVGNRTFRVIGAAPFVWAMMTGLQCNSHMSGTWRDICFRLPLRCSGDASCDMCAGIADITLAMELEWRFTNPLGQYWAASTKLTLPMKPCGVS